MYIKNKIITLLLFGMLLSQNSEDYLPYSIKNNFELSRQIISMPDLNIEELHQEDKIQSSARPYRYGYKFNVNYNLNNSGTWTVLENGDRIWSLLIQSKDAYAISLEYNSFYLPEDAYFHIYNNDMSTTYGAYTSSNNQNDMLFASPLTKGDITILEYFEPAEVINQGIINIEFVIHDYKDILGYYSNNESRTCGENVACNSADPYEDQIEATSWLDMGGYICSGAMINNTSFDLTPYYWTAWHCVVNENTSTFRFYFDYETSSCNGSWANNGTYEYGGNLLSSSNGMNPDYALILITDNTISDGIFYSGWDRSSGNPSISCGVHHPGGDPKKINYDDDNAYTSGSVNWGDADGDGNDDVSPSGSHWRITWDEGGTEGGSSGSPAFNTAGRLIGQLTGGSGDCNSSGGQDYYGKFSQAFSNVDQWLDPINSNATFINGTYESVVDSDGDGIADEDDSNDNNQYICMDSDNDTCDDCSSGTFNPLDDGWDFDNDGLCDAGDSDDDNDGALDNQDSNDNDPFECSNIDGDNCDDCANGYFNPENDGCIYMPGDLNLDNTINIIDVVMLVNIILGVVEPNETQLTVADLNNDSYINIADIVILINTILN